MIITLGNSRTVIVNLLVGFLFFPLFFDAYGIFNSIEFERRGIPASILMSCFFPYAAFVCKSAASIRLLALFLACIFFPTIFYGILNSEDFMFTLVASYAAPMLVGFSIYSLIFRTEPTVNLERLLLKGAYVVGAVATFWVFYQVNNFLSQSRADGSVFGVFVIYQVWVYWPTVLAIAFCSTFISKAQILWVLRGILLVGIVFTGAREPFLFIFVCASLYMLAHRRIKHFLMFLLIGLIFAATVQSIITFFPNALISLKFAAMLAGETSMSGGRFELLEIFQFGQVNLFWGTGFSSSGHFGTPHNQYLELYYRAGIFGAIMSAGLVYSWMLSYSHCSILGWSIFGAVLLVTNVINTPLRTPYVGAIIWTMFFFIVETRRRGVLVQRRSLSEGTFNQC